MKIYWYDTIIYKTNLKYYNASANKIIILLYVNNSIDFVKNVIKL